jgi:hypothetical protein
VGYLQLNAEMLDKCPILDNDRIQLAATSVGKQVGPGRARSKEKEK